MTIQYRTTKTSTKRLVKSLERIISLFPLVTYVNMEVACQPPDEDVIRARKLIESLTVRVGK
jgi:hypothetical protein